MRRSQYRGQKSSLANFSKSFFLNWVYFVQFLHVFKKTFSKKLLDDFSDLYIAIYTFWAHVMIMFYVSQNQRNLLVTIRVSNDAPKIFYCRRKTSFQVCPKVPWRSSKCFGTPKLANFVWLTIRTLDIVICKNASMCAVITILWGYNPHN